MYSAHFDQSKENPFTRQIQMIESKLEALNCLHCFSTFLENLDKLIVIVFIETGSHFFYRQRLN